MTRIYQAYIKRCCVSFWIGFRPKQGARAKPRTGSYPGKVNSVWLSCFTQERIQPFLLEKKVCSSHRSDDETGCVGRRKRQETEVRASSGAARRRLRLGGGRRCWLLYALRHLVSDRGGRLGELKVAGKPKEKGCPLLSPMAGLGVIFFHTRVSKTGGRYEIFGHLVAGVTFSGVNNATPAASGQLPSTGVSFRTASSLWSCWNTSTCPSPKSRGSDLCSFSWQLQQVSILLASVFVLHRNFALTCRETFSRLPLLIS